jgi:CRP/FNR family transcriptional regulator, cyclic AMP receptor protein
MSSVTPYVAVSSSSSSSPVVARGIGIDAIASKVAGHRAFGFLPEQDLRALMQWTTTRTFQPQEMIFRYGEPGRAVILVLQGYVKLSTTLANGREVVLEILGPGGCVGEVAVLNKGPREADATALSRCRLLSIDGRQFKQVFDRRPEALLTIMQLVSERLQRAREQVVDALALSAPARLAKAILQLSRLGAPDLHQGGTNRLRLSQSELGSMTGMTRESVNRYLGVWRDAGWILLLRGSVTLVSEGALSSLLWEESTHVRGTAIVGHGAAAWACCVAV